MDKKIINKLVKLADKFLKLNEFPVSAIIYKDDKIISCGYNNRNKKNLTINHAEIIAITKANKKVNNWNLSNMRMIVTLEPCEMCKKVINEARIQKVDYLVPRYDFKKTYKRTLYQKMDLEDGELDKYLYNIKNFFTDKR